MNHQTELYIDSVDLSQYIRILNWDSIRYQWNISLDLVPHYIIMGTQQHNRILPPIYIQTINRIQLYCVPFRVNISTYIATEALYTIYLDSLLRIQIYLYPEGYL